MPRRGYIRFLECDMKKPNVLFILSDQHNAKCLGHKGHPDVKTPHLDRLAKQGVRFDNAITQNPICTPSRMCFISGQYAHNHGYYGLSGPNPNGLPTIFGHFKQQGYRTAAIGKIHCPEYWVEDDCDVYHETEPSASIGGRSRAYTRHLRSKDIEHLEDHHSLQEFGRRGAQSCDGRPSMISYRDGQEGWCVTKGIEFMAQAQEEGTPFFLHISLPKPHQCYTPAQEFWDLYDEETLTLPPNADFEGPLRAPHLAKMVDGWKRGGWTRFEPKTFEAGRLRKLHGYLGNISHVDHAVGELVDFLDANGLSDDTIVVYSADHGDYAAEHGIMEKAPGICHDAITRIPFIWRWGEHFQEGHVAPELVETVDVSATLCSLCGIPGLETSDGKDLTALLNGRSGELRNIAVTEFAWSKSIRKGDWRLVYYPPEMFKEEYPDGFGELYNLVDDPWEMDNRYFDEGQQERIQEMCNDLLNWLVTTTRPVSTNCADLEEGPQRMTRYKVVVNADNKIHPDELRKVDYKNYL